MIVTCPNCKEKVDIDSAHLDESTSVVCLSCRARFRVSLNLELVRENGREAPAPRPAGSPSKMDREAVLVAVDGEATRELIEDLLKGAGFRPILSQDGRDVMALLRSQRPAAVLIDVGLSDVLGFQLWDQIKTDPELKETIVILVASIYDKSKYKRPPGSLYGAEDYVERHQIQEELLLKLRKHLTQQQSRPARPAPPSRQPETPPPRPAAPEAPRPRVVQQAAPPPPAGPEPNHEAAKRLARIIIADIALYNKGDAERGVLEGNFEQLLNEQLAEGRRHYNSRVSEEIRGAFDYFREAIQEFIQKKKGTP